MSWFFGKNKEPSLPPPTNLHTQRNRQIEALMNCNQNVIELQRDVEYRVNMSISGQLVSLHINLPPSFPQRPPVVKVVPGVLHEWVNEHMLVTGCQQLNSFSVHSDLGAVIKVIVDEFHNRPPTIITSSRLYGNVPPYSLPTCPSSMTPPTGDYAPPTSSPAYSSPDSPVRYLPAGTPLEEKLQRLPAPAPYTLPPLPTSFPELDSLSVSELESLLKDEEEQNKLISRRDELCQIQQSIKQIRMDLETAARDNLSKQPDIEERKRKLFESFDLMTQMRREFDSRMKRDDELRSLYQPAHVHTRLQIATATAEQNSDTIAESFMEGGLAVDDFKKEFINARKLWYSRKVREERYRDGGWT